ncbi:hypothetical protein [Streptomyces albidochromogenes]|nr:hypothetical protein [Streptomyces albidochromogenes]
MQLYADTGEPLTVWKSPAWAVADDLDEQSLIECGQGGEGVSEGVSAYT